MDDGSYGGQIQDMNNCLGSSAEFELALILKELRWITDQVSGTEIECFILLVRSIYSSQPALLDIFRFRFVM